MGSQSLSRTRRSNQSLERIESGRSEPSIPAKLIQVAAPASERNPLASLWPSKLRLIQVKGQGCSWGNGLLHLYLSIYLSLSLSLSTHFLQFCLVCAVYLCPWKSLNMLHQQMPKKKVRSHFWTICNVVPGDVGSCSVDALSSIANNLTTWASQ